MISRVAEHCFWFGRYLERAESTARLLRVTQLLELDAELAASQCWLPVITVSGESGPYVEKFGAASTADGELVQAFLVWNEDTQVSLTRSISALRSNARSIREVLSTETWEAVNEFHLWVLGEESHHLYLTARDNFYAKVRNHAQLVIGTLQGTMLNDESYAFIHMGIMFERVSQTARVVDVNHLTLEKQHASAHPVGESSLWLVILRACSGVEPFMKRYAGRVAPESIAQFLIFDPEFPRSIVHCVHAARSHFLSVRPRSETQLPGAESLRRIDDFWLWLQKQRATPSTAMHDMLTYCVDESARICAKINEELFGIAVVSSQIQTQ